MAPQAGPVDRELLERMCVALEHRGPDSRGVFLDEHDRARHPATASHRPRHRRSADLQRGRVGRRGPQRRDLQLPRAARPAARRGPRFATQGDTEVIVHLYEEEGARLRSPPARDVRVRALGPAAAAAASGARPDRQEAALLRLQPRRVYVRVRTARAARGPRRSGPTIDPSAVDCFLAYGYVPAPMSIFSAVRKLPPAHTLLLEDGRVTIERYWQPRLFEEAHRSRTHGSCGSRSGMPSGTPLAGD